MTVKGETKLAGGATTVPGALYTIYHSSIPNLNGIVRACPSGQVTVSAMLTALGYSGGSAAVTNVQARATGANTGLLDSGLDIFEV